MEDILANTMEEGGLNPEKGITLALEKIKALLKKKKYVVVTVSGSGENVGKSYISGKLTAEFIRHGISYSTASELYTLINAPVFGENIRHGVLIFSSEQPTLNKKGLKLQNDELKQKMIEFGFPAIKKIDIRIAVYRPDKPFSLPVISDILIKNTGAIDDPRKLGSQQ